MVVKDSNQLCVKVGLLASWPALFYHHSGLYDSISLEGLFSLGTEVPKERKS